MYLAALVAQNADVSTYFTGILGYVGGGGTSQKRNTKHDFCYGQKKTDQKLTDIYCPKTSASSSAIPSGMVSSSSSASRASAIALIRARYALVSADDFLPTCSLAVL
jgi:hypothetical protein